MVNEYSSFKKEITNNNDVFKSFLDAEKFSLKWDTYFEVYDQIFKKFRGKKITFVEVGVFSGGSLFMWKKYFGENARIIGIDLNPKAKELEEYGFEIYIGNQSSPNFWNNFYKDIGKIDVILDDGGHKNIQQINTVHNSLNYINNEGLIVVEDTHSSYLKEFKNPSKFSFINYANKIIELINRRSSMINENLNNYSKKIYSVNFFESITVFDINENKCFKSSLVRNQENWEGSVEYRDNEYFTKTKNFIENKFKTFNKISIFRKIIRKLLYKNIFFNIYENYLISKIFKEITKKK